jgi:hypothetical protein
MVFGVNFVAMSSKTHDGQALVLTLRCYKHSETTPVLFTVFEGIEPTLDSFASTAADRNANVTESIGQIQATTVRGSDRQQLKGINECSDHG